MGVVATSLLMQRFHGSAKKPKELKQLSDTGILKCGCRHDQGAVVPRGNVLYENKKCMVGVNQTCDSNLLEACSVVTVLPGLRGSSRYPSLHVVVFCVHSRLCIGFVVYLPFALQPDLLHFSR